MDGQTVTDLATQVSEEARVTVRGKQVVMEGALVLALNKPKGLICSREDLENRRTIFDLLPSHGPRLFYIGRLDKDSEGLLIVTNDGKLCHQLSHPSGHVSKLYEVGIQPKFDQRHIQVLKKGFLIEPGFARMDDVHPVHEYLVRVELSQGLNRQIRRMFAKCGYRVNSLKRIRIGGLSLGSLKSGQFRRLRQSDLQKLFRDPQKGNSG